MLELEVSNDFVNATEEEDRWTALGSKKKLAQGKIHRLNPPHHPKPKKMSTINTQIRENLFSWYWQYILTLPLRNYYHSQRNDERVVNGTFLFVDSSEMPCCLRTCHGSIMTHPGSQTGHRLPVRKSVTYTWICELLIHVKEWGHFYE